MRFALFILVAAQAWTQSRPTLLGQAKDNASACALTSSELASLGDPFYLIVLKDRPDALTLDEVEKLLQPDPSARHMFVVSESIQRAEPGQLRRAVLAFSGNNGEHVLAGNVMLSVFFDSAKFLDTEAIEAWGWDSRRGRYNYYRLDDTGGAGRAWKFRGSSEGADMLTSDERRETCMACHVNGGPVMKEMVLPWNNWHSDVSRAAYLETHSLNPWPIARTPRLASGTLGVAETLEGMIVSSIRQFNRRRINAALARRDSDGNLQTDASGLQRVVSGRRLLRHLCETTEFNIASAEQTSGLHPFTAGQRDGPTRPVRIPSSFFLNATLMGGGGVLGYRGLGIGQALRFGAEIEVEPREYKDLVQGARLHLGGIEGADAHFAWLVPEASHADNDVIDQLIRRGIITRQFAAAVIAIDLETPVLSERRAALLGFMPDQWDFKPVEGGVLPAYPDDLTRRVIAAIEASSPAAGSSAAALLENLRSPDPVKLLAQRVAEYHNQLERKVRDGATRQSELQRLFNRAIALRHAVLAHPVLKEIDETGGDRLFPAP